MYIEDTKEVRCVKRLVKASKQDIEGMSRIGYSGHLEIYINTNDAGKIPHFHIRQKDDWQSFHSCVRIDKPEYFLHAGKEDVLNAKQKRELQEFMSSPVTLSRYADKFTNNWELACFLWDINNSDVEIGLDVEQPDYTLL